MRWPVGMETPILSSRCDGHADFDCFRGPSVEWKRTCPFGGMDYAEYQRDLIALPHGIIAMDDA